MSIGELTEKVTCECDGWNIGEYRSIGGAMRPCCAHCGLPLELRHRTFDANDCEYCIECGQRPGSEWDVRLLREENDRLRHELDTAKLYLAAVAASPSSPSPAGVGEETIRLRRKNRALRRKLREARSEPGQHREGEE